MIFWTPDVFSPGYLVASLVKSGSSVALEFMLAQLHRRSLLAPLKLMAEKPPKGNVIGLVGGTTHLKNMLVKLDYFR